MTADPREDVLARIRGEVLRECLDCGYDRTGLSDDAKCPECGAPAPGSDWLVVNGRTSAGGQAFAIVVSIVFAGSGLFMLLLQLLFPPRLPLGWIASIASIAIGTTSYIQTRRRRAKIRATGGDIIWIFRGRILEVRSMHQKRRFELANYGRCDRAYSVLRRWVRLRLVPRFLTIAPTHVMWLRRDRDEERKILAEIRERIRAAEATR